MKCKECQRPLTVMEEANPRNQKEDFFPICDQCISGGLEQRKKEQGKQLEEKPYTLTDFEKETVIDIFSNIYPVCSYSNPKETRALKMIRGDYILITDEQLDALRSALEKITGCNWWRPQ